MDEPAKSDTEENVLTVFEREYFRGFPLTTNEVADALDCARRTAYNKLDALVERDLLKTKKVGARARVWWLPAHSYDSNNKASTFARSFSLSELELFSRLCDTSPIGIALVDSNHSIVFANERLAEILGRSVEEITSRSYSDPVWEIYDDSGDPIREGDHPVTRVFQTGRPVRTFQHGITRPDGTERWLSSNSAPIVADDGTIEGVVVGLQDITGLKEREKDLQSQRSELLRLNRINSVIRGVAHEMTSARSPEDVENALCRLIANSEPYLFAVLGQFSSSYTEFTPRASAGVGDEYLDAMLDNPDAPPLDQGPGAIAAKTGEIQVVQHITDLPYEYWQDAAENHRFHSYASVPLTHGEDVYGVLGVYAKLPAAFDREEQSLLTELGQMVGYALDTLETREKLRQEQVVELTFRSEALARSITEEERDTLHVMGDSIVEVADDAHLQFYTVKGISAKDATDLLDRLHTGEVRLLSVTDDRVEVEVRMPPESLASRLITTGGKIASISIEDGVFTLVVQLPDSADRRSVMSSVQEVYPELSLVSEDLVFSSRTFRHVVEARLTDRQMSTLELAYQMGYFEQPRRSTGEDVAERMGVTPTTAHRHMRNAEKRIFQELFDMSWGG